MSYTHPHMKVARMEAAIEVLGLQIAKLAAAIEDEQQLASPNEATIEAMMAEQSVLRDRQDDLSPDDLEDVANILKPKVA